MQKTNANTGISNSVARLEKCFENIQKDRMKDVPILNDQLSVKAVGFHTWREYWLGVLITPWFINLVLLPRPNQAIALPATGHKINHAFPSGSFSFIAGEEQDIGAYLACSLMSPVLDIQSQNLAEEIAVEALQAIMDPDNKDGAGDISNREVQQAWYENGETEKTASDADDNPNPSVETAVEQNDISSEKSDEEQPDMPERRQLFRRLAGNHRGQTE